MGHSRINLLVGCVLGTSLIAQAPARAQSPAGRQLTSIRYGYALQLAPGWAIAQGDCAAYAMAVSSDRSSSMQILVTSGAGSTAALRQAEAKALHASGPLHGAVTYSTLRLRNATYQTARAITLVRGVTRGVLVAGVARNQHTYLVVDTVSNPASSAGQRNAQIEQQILASLTFVKPAAAGSFTCAGTGISQKRPVQGSWFVASTPTPRVSNAPSTHTPVRNMAPVATQARPTTTPSATSSSTATATTTVAPTSTPLPSPTNTPTWTPLPTSTSLPTWTPLPTVTPTPSWTATPTQTPVTNGIPTSGTTDNGCAITPDQAAGEAHVLYLLNTHRAAAGVAPLTLLPALSVGSRDHSCDMAQHHTLSHYGSNGSTLGQRILATGTTFTMAGENIAEDGSYSSIDADIDFNDGKMMAEPLIPDTHHWIIVDSAYRRVGIGVIDYQGTVWFTEDFVDSPT
ncbi:MAG TPA: CAP domain-containing protein [Chloroflexota bacterium]|nr:CAP domain-containing protein [Chloroflexota bacterium]